MHGVDKLVSIDFYKKATPIPLYDDFICLGWQYNEMVGLINFSELSQVIIAEIELWKYINKRIRIKFRG